MRALNAFAWFILGELALALFFNVFFSFLLFTCHYCPPLARFHFHPRCPVVLFIIFMLYITYTCTFCGIYTCTFLIQDCIYHIQPSFWRNHAYTHITAYTKTYIHIAKTWTIIYGRLTSHSLGTKKWSQIWRKLKPFVFFWGFFFIFKARKWNKNDLFYNSYLPASIRLCADSFSTLRIICIFCCV